MKQTVFLITISIILSGCVNSQVQDFSVKPVLTGNAEQTSHHLQRIAIRVDSSSDVGVAKEGQKELIEQLRPYGVEVMLWTDICPPIRTYSLDEELELAKVNKIEALLKIGIGASARNAEFLGIVGNNWSSGGGSIYNSSYTYSGSSTTSVIPIIRPTRDTNSIAIVHDAKDGSIVWRASSETNAGGKLFMSDKATASSMVSEYLKALEARGFLKKPEKEDKRETALVTPIKVASTAAPSKGRNLIAVYEQCVEDVQRFSGDSYKTCMSAGIPHWIKDMTLAQKMNTAKMTDDQVDACMISFDLQLKCFNNLRKSASAVDKGAGKKLTDAYKRYEDAIGRVLSKEISVGDFNKTIFEIDQFSN